MMKTLIWITLLGLPIFGWSQNAIQHGLRVSTSLNIQPEFNSIFLGGIVPAYTISGVKGIENQIEITSLQLGRSTQQFFDPTPPVTLIGDAVTSNASLGLRHIFSFPIANASGKTIPYIGVYNSLLGRINRTQPNVSTLFETRNAFLIGQLGIVPSVKHFLTDRLYMDLGILLDFFNWEVSSFNSTNPAFPGNQNSFTQSQAEFGLPNSIQARIGVGVRF